MGFLCNTLLTSVQAVAAGASSTCALMSTGGVRCWGDNTYGQLGDGTTTSRLIPPPVDVLMGVQSIAIGDSHTCALLQTGGVRCWGDNTRGQFGDGTTTNRLAPPPADMLGSV